jgi:hypothetical protein
LTGSWIAFAIVGDLDMSPTAVRIANRSGNWRVLSGDHLKDAANRVQLLGMAAARGVLVLFSGVETGRLRITAILAEQICRQLGAKFFTGNGWVRAFCREWRQQQLLCASGDDRFLSSFYYKHVHDHDRIIVESGSNMLKCSAIAVWQDTLGDGRYVAVVLVVRETSLDRSYSTRLQPLGAARASSRTSVLFPSLLHTPLAL